MRVHLAIDSGAFSLYQRERETARKKGARAPDRARYYESKKHREYVERYVEYVKQHRSQLDFAVTVDVLYDPQRSWDATKHLEAQGISVLPVFHFTPTSKHHDDLRWLKRYLKEYDYIALGGSAGLRGPRRVGFFRACFDVVQRYRPRARIHGLGVTTFEQVFAFPWYSVDSYTAAKGGVVGRVLIPHPIFRHGKPTGFYDFSKHFEVRATPRMAESKSHPANRSDLHQKLIDEYIEQMGSSREALANVQAERIFFNNYYFRMAAQQAKLSVDLHGRVKIYFVWNITRRDVKEMLPRLEARGIHDLHILGSFYASSYADMLLTEGLVRPVMRGSI